MDWWLGWFAWFDWPPTPGNLSVELLVLLDLAFRVVAASVVSNNRRPSSAVAWLLAIFFIPFLGLFAVILYRSERDELRRQCPSCGALRPISDAMCLKCGEELEFPDLAIESEAAAEQARLQAPAR